MDCSDPTDGMLRTLLEQAMQQGLQLTEAAARAMIRHTELVYEANATLNLTRIPLEQAVSLHIVDSLLGMTSMIDAPDGSWADLGSGAGYPGIPLAVASGRHVDLIESSGKKADFLERVAADGRLDVTVRRCRAEEAAITTAAAYCALAVRAVSIMPALVELASPLLSLGGRLVCWKGNPSDEEFQRGATAARRVGMALADRRDVVIPGVEARRTIIVYTKVGESKVRLPRRPGMAQTRPLA